MLGISSGLNWTQRIPLGLAYVSAVSSPMSWGLIFVDGHTHVSVGWPAVGWVVGVGRRANELHVPHSITLWLGRFSAVATVHPQLEGRG